MNYLPDMLGPGFAYTRLEMEADNYSPRQATLIRYNPHEDPHATLPDRIVPSNLCPGGGRDDGARVLLPPAASPQQEAERAALRASLGVDPDTTPSNPIGSVLTAAQQQDIELLRGYLGAELRGRELQLATQWHAVSEPPRFSLIYFHGWNDFFFQTHLARMISHLGGAFYAIELHRYGRNMPDFPPGKPWNCYVDDYLEYDTEIEWAVKTVRAENPRIPLLLMGHSNGGNVAAGWVGRHREKVDGLLLNSPWIVQDLSVVPAGRLVDLLLRTVARHTHLTLPLGVESTYQDSLSGYGYLGLPLPKRLIPFQNDPSVRGWIQNRKFRVLEGCPVRAGWLSATLRNHTRIFKDSDFGKLPVLCLTGNNTPDPFYAREILQADRITQRSLRAEGRTEKQRRKVYENFNSRVQQAQRDGTWLPTPEGTPYYTQLLGWTEAARHRDTVLNGELIAKRAVEVFPDTAMVKQLSGLHDLTLSQPLERVEFFAEIAQWIHQQGF